MDDNRSDDVQADSTWPGFGEVSWRQSLRHRGWRQSRYSAIQPGNDCNNARGQVSQLLSVLLGKYSQRGQQADTS